MATKKPEDDTSKKEDETKNDDDEVIELTGDETFEEMTTGGGGQTEDGRAARLLEWHWDPDPTDSQVRVDMTLLLRQPDGTVHSVHEPHFMNRFPRACWAQWIREAGFELVESDTFLAVEVGAHFLARATT